RPHRSDIDLPVLADGGDNAFDDQRLASHGGIVEGDSERRGHPGMETGRQGERETMTEHGYLGLHVPVSPCLLFFYSSAANIPAALCKVSSYSASGSESATRPPPTGN